MTVMKLNSTKKNLKKRNTAPPAKKVLMRVQQRLVPSMLRPKSNILLTNKKRAQND